MLQGTCSGYNYISCLHIILTLHYLLHTLQSTCSGYYKNTVYMLLVTYVQGTFFSISPSIVYLLLVTQVARHLFSILLDTVTQYLLYILQGTYSVYDQVLFTRFLLHTLQGTCSAYYQILLTCYSLHMSQVLIEHVTGYCSWINCYTCCQVLMIHKTVYTCYQ